MTYPSWWQFALLALAAFRVTRLIGWDDLTIGPRRRVTGMGDEEHKQWAYVIDHFKEAGLDPWTHVEPVGQDEERWDNDRTASMSREQLRAEWQRSPYDSGLRAARLGGLHWGIKYATGKDQLPPLADAAQLPPVSPRRYYLSKMLRCPWCLGFWVSLAFGVAWGGWHDAWLSGAVMALPLSAAIGLLAKNLDP